VIVLDLWDVLAIVGLLLVLLGAAAIYWPLALILGGGLLLGAYYLRECRHAAEPTDAGPLAEPVRAREDE
jgi:hypothetical protein